MTQSWSQVLDSLAAQVELQRKAIAYGTPAPPDLEIDPPAAPLGDPSERLRALALLEESELLADIAVDRLVAARSRQRGRGFARRP
jgi:hypothetical protein